ncbi:MAG: dephospho-CoA kinase, partial [Zetaproteobacteria bacterium]
MIPWVGVVGGIGAGKSALCRIWAGLGVPTLDLDELGRLLWDEPEVRKALSALFPEAVRNGRLDRKAVARLAFAARKRLRALEAVLHPRIWEEAARWRARAQGAYAAVEASALLESGAEAKMDAVVAV